MTGVLLRRRNLRHKRIQREDTVKRQEEMMVTDQPRREAWNKPPFTALRRNPPRWHLNQSHTSSLENWVKVNVYCLSHLR